MKFEGTYTYLMDTPSGKRETKVVIRKGSRAYEGELIASHGGCGKCLRTRRYHLF